MNEPIVSTAVVRSNRGCSRLDYGIRPGVRQCRSNALPAAHGSSAFFAFFAFFGSPSLILMLCVFHKVAPMIDVLSSFPSLTSAHTCKYSRSVDYERKEKPQQHQKWNQPSLLNLNSFVRFRNSPAPWNTIVSPQIYCIQLAAGNKHHLTLKGIETIYLHPRNLLNDPSASYLIRRLLTSQGPPSFRSMI